MNRLSFFLGWRYLIGSKNDRSVSAMIIICFLGILIGSFALAIVASVMNGFEYTTHKKIQGIHSQIIIDADGQMLDFAKIASVINKEFSDVDSFSARANGYAIIQDQETGSVHDVVLIKGIDPKNESLISNLEKKIILPDEKGAELNLLLSKDQVIVGSKLAQLAEINLGEPITLFIAHENNIRSNKIKFKNKNALVSGTFKTGIDEFDRNVIFCSLSLFEKFFPEHGPTEIGIKLRPGANENKIIKSLKKRLGMNVYSWKELYPALVSALKLEKYSMFLILALITLVASMNIISLMFMQISRKRVDIAIFKTIGMNSADISRTFLFIGMIISIAGSILGLIGAFIVGLILEHYPFISLPDAYYVSHLPSRMTMPIFLTVFIVVMMLSLFSSWFAANRTKKINISHVLRFEG